MNKPQIDIKRETCEILTWEKHLFLDIYSTSIDMRVPSLYQPVETLSMQVFRPMFQPDLHLRFINCDFRTSLREILDQAVNRFTGQTLPAVNKTHSIINILYI
jgi:hypothetical protein